MSKEEIIRVVTSCDELIEKMRGYSTSAEVTEVDDICRLFHGELDTSDEWHRNIIATYAGMTNTEIMERFLDLYQFLLNESIITLRTQLRDNA